jgi:hypothetical protein
MENDDAAQEEGGAQRLQLGRDVAALIGRPSHSIKP